MTHLSHIFDIRTSPPTSLTLEQQRKKWLMEFLKTYAVLVIVYGGFYLLRTNFKSAQPFLVEQVGLTTTQLGTIGFAFSLQNTQTFFLLRNPPAALLGLADLSDF